MPRKQLAQVVDEVDESAFQVAPPPPDPYTDEDGIQSVELELDGLTGSKGAYVNIYRLAHGKPDAYLVRLAPEEFSVENVKQQYGGGVYRIRVYQRNDKNQSRIARTHIITIAEEKQSAKIPALAAPAPDVTSALIASLQDGFSRLGTMILEARPQPESEERMLQKMMLYKQLFAVAPVGPVSPPMTEMLGAVKEVLALSNTMREYGGGDGGGPDSMSVLMKAMDTFGKPLLEGIVAAQSQAQPGQVIEAGQMLSAPVAPAAQPQGDDMVKMMAKMYLAELCNVASKKADPGLYADVVMDRVPEDALAELVMPADWMEKMIAIQPLVALHRGWFMQLREIVYQELTAPEEADIPDNSKGSDVPSPDSRQPGQGNP